MIGPLDLGFGDLPDIAALPGGGWLTVRRAEGTNLRVRRHNADGSLRAEYPIDIGEQGDSDFARVCVNLGRLLVAYRAMRAGKLVLALLDVTTAVDITQEHIFADASNDGNDEVCFGLGWLAWQQTRPTVGVFALKLDTGEHRQLRPDVRPTGLSRLIGDPTAPQAVFADDDRGAVPGMLNPAWAGAAVIGESPSGGLAVQLDGKRGVLMPGTYTTDPSAAADGMGTFAAVWWAPQGPRCGMVLFTTADVVPPPPPTIVYPTYRFDHPVIVAPFAAEGSGLPSIYDYGAYYTEYAPAIPPTANRVLLLHDGESDWNVPSGLRPYDVVLRELYRVPAETLTQSGARWIRQVQTTLAQWAGDVGVVPMFYDQLLWTVPEILDGLRFLSAVVNLSPRIKLIAPFAYDRKNGVVKYPELQQTLRDLEAAHQAAGTATLTPIHAPRPLPVFEESTVMAASQIMGILYYVSKKPSSRAKCWNYIQPDGRPFSCQPGGVPGSRDPGTDGAWEEGEGDAGQEEQAGIATFHVNGEYYSFLAIRVDALP